MTTKSTPNIPAAKAAFSLQSSISIVGDERISSTTVWNALIDTSTWPRWNRFVPRVEILQNPPSQHAADNGRHAANELSPILQLGSRIRFYTNLDAPLKDRKSLDDSSDKLHVSQPLMITVFEPPNPTTKEPGRIVWTSDINARGSSPPWLLFAERIHEIYEEDGADGAKRIRISNWENLTGWLVYVVRWLFGRKLQDCFEVWVDDLKTFVEESTNAES